MKLEKVTGGGEPTVKRWYDDACGIALAMEFVGERWSLLVMREMVFGPRRFGEIKANLPGVSANVLTQRLDNLEAAGIVQRSKLASPANVQVYGLTRWGLEAQVVMRALGRWATRSRLHDPMAFMSSASAMMALQTMVDEGKARAAPITVAFRFPADSFVARVADGAIAVERGEAAADATFTGDTMALRVTIFGRAPLGDAAGLAVSGDAAVAQRFVDLIALPETIA